MAALARRLEVAKATPYNWVDAGVITRRADGKVCLEDARAALAAIGRRPGSGGGDASAPPESVGLPPEDCTRVEAQRRKEVALATLRELEVRKLRGELVDVAAVEAVLFEWAREVRDRWQAVPAAWAADLAAEWGLEVRAVRVRLDDMVRAGLEGVPPLELADRLARRGVGGAAA